MDTRQNSRRYDLDWLRVLAFGVLILFHTGMLFNGWDWHIKNPRTSEVFEWVMIFFSQWRMALLFFVSGAAVWFALDRYSAAEFTRERLKRLLLPLAFGMFVVIPPQVYLERLFRGGRFDSFSEFYLTVLEFNPYPEGNFSWHHLWYIPYILMFSLLTLPLFRRLKTRWRAGLDSLVARLEGRGHLLLLFLPLAISEATLRPFWPSNANNLVGDWAQFTSMLIVFCYGFLLVSRPTLWTLVEADRFRALRLALATTSLLYPVWFLDFITLSSWQYVFYRFLRCMNMWFWLLALLGLARRYLNFNSSFLKYANEAVYPFYIVHQTITVALGYFLLNWQAGILVKFVVVASGTFLGSCAIYEAVRRFNGTRILFGLRPLTPKDREEGARWPNYMSWGVE